MKKIFAVILILLLTLSALLIFRTLTHPFVALSDKQPEPVKVAVTEKSIARFSGGLKFETVSHIDSADNNFAEYEAFREYVRNAYPRIFEQLDDTLINGHQWILRWKGKNASLAPLLWMAHYDVVHPGEYNDEHDHDGQNMFEINDEPAPVPTEEFEEWKYPPFSGAVAEGRIYGRGALDMKNVMFSLLEAADTLMAQGFNPERDIYFTFNPDEEVGGLRGARKAAEYFKSNGIRFEAIYDEGGIIATPGTVDGVNQNIALVGLGEKGVVGYRIKVKGTGGHSSMPPLQTAAGKAAIIMERLEKNQMPQRLIGPTADFLNLAGSGMGFVSKMAIANQWLFKGILLNKMAEVPQSNALTRSTTAITMLKGSNGVNVLPQVVEVVVNYRILPGETSEDVLNHIKKQCEGFDVEIDAMRIPVEPSAISPADGRAFDIIRKGVAQYYPETIVSPYVTIGATDSKHMGDLSDRIYRFAPVLLHPAEQRTIHNFNEYITIENYGRMIAYYTYLISHYDKAD